MRTRLTAVTSVVSGYTGGHDPHPDYYSVCSGTTGHAEVVAVTFDEEVIPAEVILDMFFALHDPTTLNRQGYDVGTQYRSSMFYETTEEKILFEEAIERNHVLVFNWLFDVAAERPRLPPQFHRDLADALIKGDPELADTAMRAHVRYGIDRVVAGVSAKLEPASGMRRVRTATTE